MAEEPLKEPKAEDEGSEKPVKFQRTYAKRLREFENAGGDGASRNAKKIKGTLLAINKPSYCLKKGIGNLQCWGETLRSQHRKRLWRVLRKLVRRHNWVEASGVLSLLLQATVKDDSQSRNHAKYLSTLEVLNHIKGETFSSRKIQSVYELWMKKLGPLRKWSTKARFAVQLEYILTCLQLGNMEDAHQTAICLMQECDFESDPLANLVVGLTFYQLWYSGIPKELQLDPSSSYMQSDISFSGLHIPVDYSKENDAHKAGKDNSVLQCDSNTSIAIDKKVIKHDDNQERESKDVDDRVKKETSNSIVQPLEFDGESVEPTERSESLPNYGNDLPQISIFHTKGLPPWLLPMKLLCDHENVEDALNTHWKLHESHYKSAVKHLRVALHSTPPVPEALHPLIQMLLLGDHVLEALDELETSFHSADTPLQLRLKASLLEHFDSGNYVKLCTCFEDILKSDPTCNDSLMRLVLMHQRGDYDTLNLVEMIALHLDASYGTSDAWKELASCFLKLSQSEGDRMSTCYDRNNQGSEGCFDTCNKIPDIFTNGDTGESWRLRARWWLNRHFNNQILMRDSASGDLKLLTYKAAAASHFYGRQFRYVLKATEQLEKEDKMELYSFLQTHILNSVGFYYE